MAVPKKIKGRRRGRGGRGWKLLLIALAVLAVAVAAGMQVMSVKKKGEVAGAAEAYMNGVSCGDFSIVFNYHGPSQRRKLMLMQRSGDDVEARLEELFNEREASFREAEPGEDLSGEWSEKALFVDAGEFRVLGVEMVEDIDNPSQPLRDRQNAIVTVEAVYHDEEGAPDLGGKIKKAVFNVKMVHSSNVARTLRGEVPFSRWLFQSVSMEEGTVERW
ncbi:MAG: hypothetical protein V3W31_01645 [Thermodesulfobacteriota bacterium]